MELTRRQSLMLLGAGLCHAGESILGQWRRIAAETDGLVGAAAFNFNSGQSVSLNGDVRFPMASVCKLPLR